jgi:23S rRNA pseudouridine2605 synthase
MRLNRFLAAAGFGSRRHCDELIAAGRVAINGEVCRNFSAQPKARDHVKVDGKLIHTAPALTILLNKPRGLVSTRKDPYASDTVFDLIPEKFSRLFTIGRLDAQTEGLLLLTNDGELAQRLTHPRFKVDKEYEVTLDRPWDPALTPKLLRGIVLDGRCAKIVGLRSSSPARLRVILRQGINRQIRRMFEATGYGVKRLLRVRIGSLRLADLPCGHWRALTQQELRALELKNSVRVVAAGVDRGRSKARQASKRGHRPRLQNQNETGWL